MKTRNRKTGRYTKADRALKRPDRHVIEDNTPPKLRRKRQK